MELDHDSILDEMSPINKLSILMVVVIPFLATLYVMLAGCVSRIDLGIFLIMYCIMGFGVTIGYHRLLTHKSFRTYKWIQYFFAILGTAAVQGPVLTWVSDHRKHHKFTDVLGDPHSPHVDYSESLSGLYHAHMGWLLKDREVSDWRIYAKDLCDDEVIRWINRRNDLIVLFGLLVPTVIGGILTYSLEGALSAFVWGGLVRTFFTHHVTWSINSICHFHGFQDLTTKDYSTNVSWLALPSLGESWHNNHHAFPASASHGLRWWQIDISFMIIRAMEFFGLAWDVVRYNIDYT